MKNRLRLLSRSEKGYLTIESTIIVPLLMTTVCILVVFFYFYLKIGAFQALVNHQKLAAALETRPYFQVGQIEDKNSQLELQTAQKDSLDDFTRLRAKNRLRVSSPLGSGEFRLESASDQLHMPFLYQLAAAKNLGEGLSAIRDKWQGEGP